MDKKEIRSALAQHELNSFAGSLLFVEITLFAALMGAGFKGIWVGIGAWVFLILMLFNKITSSVLIFIFSVGWGYVGYTIGGLSDSFFIQAGSIFIGFSLSIGLHYHAMQYVADL